MSEHVSRFDLDALRLGELPAERAEVVRVHVDACARCAQVREELARSVVEFEQKFDPGALAEQTLAASAANPAVSRPAPWWRLPKLGWRIGLAVPAAALAVMLALRLSPAPDAVRTKGTQAAIEIFSLGPKGDMRPMNERGVALGSTLRFRWDPGSRRYARFVWESAAGQLEALYPAADEPALESKSEGPRWLEYDVNLDRDPKTEYLHAIYCDHPIDAAAAEAAIRAGSTGCDVRRAAITKDTPP